MVYRPSDEQLSVLNSPAQVMVVVGGAGSGKTTTAAAAAARRLTDLDAKRALTRRLIGTETVPPVKRVLFVSFSRTAVSQILDRSTEILGSLRSRVDVMTFHGLAWRILNDFGRFYGYPHPLRVQSAAEAALPAAFPGMTYDELLPAALQLLAYPTVREFYERRYATVICDEFQDTSDTEWSFIQAIAPTARRILLGDRNQCIYAGMKRINPDARMAEAQALWGSKLITLPPQSHRDPSGVLPAAAQAALLRRFDDPSIRSAVVVNRLVIHRVSSTDRVDAAVRVAADERGAGRTVSLFTHTNAAAFELSSALSVGGMDHEQVGFSEAFGDGLQAQLMLLRWVLEQEPGARQALAVYLRSVSRGQQATADAVAVMNATDPVFEGALRGVGADLRTVAGPPTDFDALHAVLREAHHRLGFPRGAETWVLANRQLRRAARVLEVNQPFEVLAREVDEIRGGTLVGVLHGRPKPVQVMNLHQTKGREADATILMLQPDEWHGYEQDPYPAGSRLLYVCMTRARERAHIVVPDQVHGLWLPFVNTCLAAQGQA